MDISGTAQETLTVSEKSGANQDYIPYDDGTYEAKYTGLKVFMDNSPWGEKKAARLYFEFTRGKYRTKKITYKGNFVLDKETGTWFIGSKTKLAEVIKAITGGKDLNKESVGRKVFITVTNTPIKNGARKGEMFSGVSSIIPVPDDGDEVADVTPISAVPAPAPVSNQALAGQASAAGFKAPAAVPTATVAPAGQLKQVSYAAQKTENLMDDLTEFSDFK